MRTIQLVVTLAVGMAATGCIISAGLIPLALGPDIVELPNYETRREYADATVKGSDCGFALWAFGNAFGNWGKAYAKALAEYPEADALASVRISTSSFAPIIMESYCVYVQGIPVKIEVGELEVIPVIKKVRKPRKKRVRPTRRKRTKPIDEPDPAE